MPEKNAELRRVCQRRDWAKKTPEEKLEKNRKSYEYKKARMLRDPEYAEKVREKDRVKKAKKRRLKGEKLNERQRELYRENYSTRIETIRNGKRRRNPTIGLASLERDVRVGRKDVRELLDRTLAAINECSALSDRRTRKGIPK